LACVPGISENRMLRREALSGTEVGDGAEKWDQRRVEVVYHGRWLGQGTATGLPAPCSGS
jgi:hypothetical protein